MRDVFHFFIYFLSNYSTVPYDCVFALNCGRMRLPSSTFGSLSKSTFYVLNFHVGNGVHLYVSSFFYSPSTTRLFRLVFFFLSSFSEIYFPTACERCVR